MLYRTIRRAAPRATVQRSWAGMKAAGAALLLPLLVGKTVTEDVAVLSVTTVVVELMLLPVALPVPLVPVPAPVPVAVAPGWTVLQTTLV